MSVFPERRFDVVLDTFNPHTGKTFHIHLTVFQRMWEIISSNMFDNAVSLDYHFLCLLWHVTFPRNCVGTIVTKFYQQLYLLGLILKSCTWIITTLISFTGFISRVTIYVCTCNIFNICVVTNCAFINLKIFFIVLNWFSNFFNWFKWIIFFHWTEEINIVFVFFN